VLVFALPVGLAVRMGLINITNFAQTAFAALLLGIADVVGSYYGPWRGGFIVYSRMITILVWRPQGLFVRKGGDKGCLIALCKSA
jgi:branched-subunit amino acid ABC-type transport system permease component